MDAGRRRDLLPTLFAATLFLSAALLFLVQPMIAKMILPLLGGTPAVWNTCMVFFQTMLLAGYLYAYFAPCRLGVRRHATIHLGILALPFLALPLLALPLVLARETDIPPPWSAWIDGAVAILPPLGSVHPIAWLVVLLAVSVGLPFFVLSTTAPLLQQWFADSDHPSAHDPYFLYGASNVGSLAALAAYPLLVEPYLTLWTQCSVWIAGYALLVAFNIACAVFFWSLPNQAANEERPFPPPAEELESVLARYRANLLAESRPYLPTFPDNIRWSLRCKWLALAFVPSSLLLGVTSFLATDVASAPLLWVVPLALYLLTFVLAFARFPLIPPQLTRILPIVLLLQPFLLAATNLRPAWALFAVHWLSFFLIATCCHGELARLRPGTRRLGEFYLWLSLGGVLGGVFNALVAPLLFDSLVEYPISLVLACFLMPVVGERPRLGWLDLLIPLGLLLLMLGLQSVAAHVTPLALWATLWFGLPTATIYLTSLRRPLRFGLCLGAMFLVGVAPPSNQPNRLDLVAQARSFFGVVRVHDYARADGMSVRSFVHGSTLHGRQILSDDPATRRQPLTYYFRNAAIGQLFDNLARRSDHARRRVAVLGLGAGTLAAYAEAGQSWTFFEIDPLVASMARQHFHFLADAEGRGASVRVVLGDARRELRHAPDAAFDLILADAFSSDAIPMHLLTREALALYLAKLGDDGILAFNISNRYLDLEPVLGTLATEAKLVGRSFRETREQIAEDDWRAGKTPSHWIVLARRAESFGGLPVSRAGWSPLRVGEEPWTDDFSNLLSVLKWD
jgi:SAM-dependent methyltransferase